MVRAKFSVWSVQHNLGQDGKIYSVDVKLGAVTGGNEGDREENKAFWKATPSGQLTMTITNPDAYAAFLPGKQFYLDFTEIAVVPAP